MQIVLLMPKLCQKLGLSILYSVDHTSLHHAVVPLLIRIRHND